MPEESAFAPSASTTRCRWSPWAEKWTTRKVFQLFAPVSAASMTVSERWLLRFQHMREDAEGDVDRRGASHLRPSVVRDAGPLALGLPPRAGPPAAVGGALGEAEPELSRAALHWAYIN